MCSTLRLAGLALFLVACGATNEGLGDGSDSAMLRCEDDIPATEVYCDADDTDCLSAAIEAGGAFSYGSSTSENFGQFNSSRTTWIVGNTAWQQHSGVEDLCEGDSLEIVVNEAFESCEDFECILDAVDAGERAVCYDTWDCGGV